MSDNDKMNVDEAMEIATSTAITLSKLEMAEVSEVLADEVERLRAELAACQNLLDETRTELSICGAFHSLVKEGWQLEVEKVNRLEAELAAAKAASELPVQVIDCYSFGDDVEVVCKCGDDADRLSGWIRERMKENSI